MDRQLGQQVIGFLESRGGRATFNDIRHALGWNVQKKDLNRTLYGLKNNGSVTKLADSPPTWGLSGGGRSSSMQVSHGARRHPMRGGREGHRPRPYNPPPMPTPSSPIMSPQSAAAAAGNMETAVLQTLSTHGSMTALQLAKSLQFLTRKSVNPLLYGMEKSGLVKHTKPPEGAPIWTIVSSRQLPSPAAGFATQQQFQQTSVTVPPQSSTFSMGSNPAISTRSETSGIGSSPVSSMGLPTSSMGSSDAQQLTADMSGESSQSTPRSDMDTGEGIDPEIQQALRDLPDDDVGERVLAVLHAKPDELFADSQLAVLIGGERERNEVGAWLKHLEKEGRVRRTIGRFPILFGLSSNPQLQIQYEVSYRSVVYSVCF